MAVDLFEAFSLGGQARPGVCKNQRRSGTEEIVIFVLDEHANPRNKEGVHFDQPISRIVAPGGYGESDLVWPENFLSRHKQLQWVGLNNDALASCFRFGKGKTGSKQKDWYAGLGLSYVLHRPMAIQQGNA